MKKTILLLMILAMLLGAASFAQAESDKVYKLGDTMQDFTATLCDGTEVSLYGMLSEKKAVVINFWATWCGPCRIEFPCLQEAYEQVEDDVGLVALSVEASDTAEVIAAFREENELGNLPMGADTGKLNRRFSFTGIPTTVLVDRNGVICFIETGSVTETEKFLNLFSIFTADEYSEPILLNDFPNAALTVEKPDSEVLSAALNAEGGELIFTCSESFLQWPFVPGTEGASSANMGTPGSEVAVNTTVDVSADQALAFEYTAALDEGLDSFQVGVDNSNAFFFSGTVPEWSTGYVLFDEAGIHEISFTHVRSSYSTVDQSVSLRNVRLVSREEAIAGIPNLPQTLEGKAAAIEILNDNVMEAVIRESSYPDETINAYVINDDVIRLRLLLGEELNPFAARYMDSQGNLFMLNSMKRDEEGYLIETDLATGIDGAINDFYLEASLVDEEAPIVEYIVFANEDDLSAYLDLVMEHSENLNYTWEYVQE